MLITAAACAGVVVVAGCDELSGVDFGWHPGQLVVANTPVYARSIDGWACHFLSECQGETRRAEDPRPVWFSEIDRLPVQIECSFGSYYKVHAGPREGWVPRSEVSTDYKIVVCDPFQWGAF